MVMVLTKRWHEWWVGWGCWAPQWCWTEWLLWKHGVGHHCVVSLSPHYYQTMCVNHGVCEDRGVWFGVHDLWFVCCGWRQLVALVVGCMALSSTCVPLCHSSQMALITHAHFLLHDITQMGRGPGDLSSCIGWLFCDYSFSLSNHNCLIFFLKPSFLLTSTSSCMLRYGVCDALYGFGKLLILFLLISVIDGLSVSILWSLDGTVFLLSHCLPDMI